MKPQNAPLEKENHCIFQTIIFSGAMSSIFRVVLFVYPWTKIWGGDFSHRLHRGTFPKQLSGFVRFFRRLAETRRHDISRISFSTTCNMASISEA